MKLNIKLLLLTIPFIGSCSLSVSSAAAPQPIVIEMRQRYEPVVNIPGRPTADELTPDDGPIGNQRRHLRFTRGPKGSMQFQYEE